MDLNNMIIIQLFLLFLEELVAEQV